MPPDLRMIGASPFGNSQRARLAEWIREAGWPRGQMSIVELEGYLVALIAWPVGVPSGAWLPPIWGGHGWRVPTKIAARSQFEDFIALIVGFMREIDRTLTQQSSRFESSVLRSQNDRARVAGLRAWSKGFMTGLALGSQGLKWRNEDAGAAVRVIATHTSASTPSGPRAIEGVVSAIFTLMAQRGSRGPLGPLDAMPARSPCDECSKSAATDESARKSPTRSR